MLKLEVRGVTMDYPGVRALDGVSLGFESGEVHGIVGENGAGKSTLMRILGGLQRPTSGEVSLDGQPVALTGVRDAQSRGIAMIHQELDLVEKLTVAENVFLGREISKAGVIERVRTNEATQAVLRQIGAPFPATARVEDLSIAGKQLVEIAKALSVNASVLIMDEPTAVLSEHESVALFGLIRHLRERGVTVLYISHRLTEVCAICERISVLRDGTLVATVSATGANPAELADLMVGRALGDFYPAKVAPPAGTAVLEIISVRGISFSIRPGEIVGLAGLIGAGRTELAEAIVGIRSMEGGEIRVAGVPVRTRSPKQAMRHGLAYLSEDRKRLGLHMSLSAVQNVTLANLRAYSRLTIDRTRERESAEGWRDRLHIRGGSLGQPVLGFSGGNQQKIEIAKWLETRPRVLILDEPTRGVDVGAKREIYNVIQRLAAEGMACLVISSELGEIIGLCHRALVMRDGHLTGDVPEQEFSEEAIMRLAAGVAAA